jgi:membrane-associated phospholipid phosphatase
MFVFEQLSIVVFASFALVSLVAPPQRRTGRVAGASLLAAALVVALAVTASTDVRFWCAHLYLVLGYWIPALLASPQPDGWFERWLIRTETMWRPFGSLSLAQGRRVAFAAPRWIVALGEICYLLCYPLVPTAFLVTWIRGTPIDVDRFWTAALASGLACYGSLPWLVSRPPRLVETLAPAGASASTLAKFNVAMLRRVGHELNTFPSGHVAVAVSIAFAVHAVWPAGAWLFGALAAGIAFGAVVGRYHYAIDTVAGAIVGAIVGAATSLAI